MGAGQLKKNITVTEIKRDNKNYRHQGLGTKLLQLLIEHAKERKVKRLYGSVMKDDIAKILGLVGWYEWLGFQKRGPYQGCIANAEVWIFVDLT
jgi:GNAT superfamily N-acetyltransferase